MKQLIVVLTLSCCVLRVAGNLNPVIDKCCPGGEVVSVSENFTCSYAGNRSWEVYQFRDHSRSREIFSTCPEGKNLIVTPVNDVIEPTIRANNACIDVMYYEEEDISVAVIFRCASNGSNEEAAGIGSLAVPMLTTLRMCCGIDHVYDVGIRDCVFKKGVLNVPENFKFLSETLEFVTVVRGAPLCKSAVLDFVVNVTRDLRLLDDGRMEVILATDDGSETIIANGLSENNTCLDEGTSGTPGLVVIRACSGDDFCNRNPCVRKCCPEDQAMIHRKCNKLPPDVSPGYFHNMLHNQSVNRGLKMNTDALESSDYGMLIGKTCRLGMFPLDEDEPWHITPLGYIDVRDYKIYGHDEYCLELLFDNGVIKDGFRSLVCFDHGPEYGFLGSVAVIFGIFASLQLISCIFLIVTLIVYSCLPELRNIHGKILMCHIVSLIVGYAGLATIILGRPAHLSTPITRSTRLCIYIGFMTLMSWIAAFSWMNVMCFDIWWTLGGPGSGVLSGDQGRAYNTTFAMYSLYAWGFALFVTCFAFIADDNTFLPLNLRPNMGMDNSCWFARSPDLYGEIIFYIGPTFVQIVANIIFFGLTARYCNRVKSEITRFTDSPTDSGNRRYHSVRAKYIINIKLFAVMGVFWIFEVIAYFYRVYFVDNDGFFYAPDAYNYLRGVIIFILFVCKSKVYYALLKRLGCEAISDTAPTGADANVLQDPYRVRNTGNNGTLASTSALSTNL